MSSQLKSILFTIFLVISTSLLTWWFTRPDPPIDEAWVISKIEELPRGLYLANDKYILVVRDGKLYQIPFETIKPDSTNGQK